MKKQLIALFLAGNMALGTLAFGFPGYAKETGEGTAVDAFAAARQDTAATSGQCGENITWSYDRNSGVLRLDGSGRMYDFNVMDHYAPWYNFRQQISEIVFDDNITYIGIASFQGLTLTHITLPAGLKEIGDAAFHNDRKLESIDIPEGVETIRDAAFMDCTALSKISLPSTLTNVEEMVFRNTGITSSQDVTFPASLKTLSYRMFSDCRNLVFFDIPDTVETVKSNCVSGESLETVHIGKNAKIFETNDIEDGFSWGGILVNQSESPKLRSFTVDAENRYYKVIDGGVLVDRTSGELLQYPPARTESTYSVPDEVKAIHKGAFYATKNLRNIVINGSCDIGEEVFCESESLERATLGGGCTFQGETFGRTNLTDVSLGEGITCLHGALSCTPIEHIQLPRSLTSLVSEEFMECTKLKSIRIPSGIATIPWNAFLDCTELESVYIPKSVTKIENYVFGRDDKLTDIYYEGSEDDWNRIDIDYSTDYETDNIGMKDGTITIHYNAWNPEDTGNSDVPVTPDAPDTPAVPDTGNHWEEMNGRSYWYESGVRQGTSSDPQGVWYAGTNRGREIYDPASNAWYWLDSVYGGAKAVGKEVFMPYIYQNEKSWDDAEIRANADASDEGLRDYVYDCIQKGTGKWVRYDENGAMLKGWVTIEGKLAELYPDQAGNTYYYDTKTGLMAKGHVTLAGQDHYFDDTTGAMVY